MAHPDVTEHIKRQNDAGRLALAVYLLHGYPTLGTSQEAFEVLRRYNPIFECGLPVATLRSPFTSPTIKRVHQVAAESKLTDEGLLAFYAEYRPNMLVHTEDEDRQGTQALLAQLTGAVDSVFTDDPRLTALLEPAPQPAPRGLPRLVQYVSPLSETPGQDFAVYSGDMLVYVGLADRMGGDLLPLKQVQAAVDEVAASAPHAKLLCGFGVRSAADVAYVRRLNGVHGVAIGTEAMDRLGEGVSNFEDWLSEISQELAYQPVQG